MRYRATLPYLEPSPAVLSIHDLLIQRGISTHVFVNPSPHSLPKEAYPAVEVRRPPQDLWPRDVPLPSLPEVAKRPKNAGMELWLRVSPEEARFIQLLAEWNKAHDLLGKLVPESDPTITALIKDATDTVAEPWLIVSIAQPAKTDPAE